MIQLQPATQSHPASIPCCPVCRGTELHSAGAYVRCGSCQHETRVAEGGSGILVNDVLDAARIQRSGWLTRAQVRLARRVATRGGLLVDVGCGPGKFLWHARKYFPQLMGIEPSPEAAEFARTLTKAQVFSALPDHLPAPALVTGWHSLEHIPIRELDTLLDGLARAADGETRVLVCVPNAASWQYRWLGPAYAYYDLMHHLHHFTPTSLDLLMERHGFARCGRSFLLPYTAFGWVQGLLNLVLPVQNYHYYRLKRGAAFDLSRRRRFWYGLLAFLAMPVCLAAGLLLTSAEFFVAGRQGVITAWYRTSDWNS